MNQPYRSDAQDDLRALYAKIEKARENPCDFIEFCGVDELSNERVKAVAAHQRVLVDFVMAHPTALVIMPPGFAKTFTLAMLALWFIGRDPTTRGVVVSWTEEQASKVLSLMIQLIEDEPRIQLVFPGLRRGKGAWTTTEIDVERPIGLRDHTCAAIGLKSGKILGSRLNFILLDDVLTLENTMTKEMRDKVHQLITMQVTSRLDVARPGRPVPRLVFTNTAWHWDDSMHRHRNPPPRGPGKPCLRMEATGNLYLYNTDWDTPLVRPAHENSPPEECRLTAHDPDPENLVPIWPARFDIAKLTQLKEDHLPIEWMRLYLGICRDDETAWCKREYVEKCFELGRGLEMIPDGKGLHRVWKSKGICFTGVDLAFREGQERDYTCFFTFEILPDGLRRVLDIEYGQWSAPAIVEKIQQKHRAYDSILSVETNAAQKFIVDFGLAADIALPVKGRTTTARKWDPTYGVPSLFIEMSHGAWAFPCDRYGRRPAVMTRFSEECLEFVPSKHTGDGIMAACMARDQAREWGFGIGAKLTGKLGALPAGKGMTKGDK